MSIHQIPSVDLDKAALVWVFSDQGGKLLGVDRFDASFKISHHHAAG